MSESNELEGIGGWLILVAIGIVLAPVRIAVMVFPMYADIFSSEIWTVLTTPGTEAYNPAWAPILIGEVLINAGLVVAWIYVAFLFFSKKAVFPKVYIGLLAFTVVFIVVDAFAIKMVMPNEPVFDPDTVREFARSFIGASIWIPYMLVSKRVKATFVN